MLDSAINLFLRGDEDSIRCAVSTLYALIDGMLLFLQFHEVGKRELSQAKRTATLENSGLQKYPTDEPTLVPRLFGEYLRTYFFKDFDMAAGNLPQSRHAVSHGLSRAEEHTKENALKLLLIINKIAWCTN